MKWQSIFSIIGFMVVLCGFMMLFPAGLDYFLGHIKSAKIFAVTAALTVAAGSVLLLSTEKQEGVLKTKEMFVTTTLIWLFYIFFCALPYFFSFYDLGFARSIFESVSGLTTTGATIFRNLDSLSEGVLLWRSLTHWMGGLGILVVAILILPTLRTGGMQLFNIEVEQVCAAGEIQPCFIHTEWLYEIRVLRVYLIRQFGVFQIHLVVRRHGYEVRAFLLGLPDSFASFDTKLLRHIAFRKDNSIPIFYGSSNSMCLSPEFGVQHFLCCGVECIVVAMQYRSIHGFLV